MFDMTTFLSSLSAGAIGGLLMGVIVSRRIGKELLENRENALLRYGATLTSALKMSEEARVIKDQIVSNGAKFSEAASVSRMVREMSEGISGPDPIREMADKMSERVIREYGVGDKRDIELRAVAEHREPLAQLAGFVRILKDDIALPAHQHDLRYPFIGQINKALTNGTMRNLKVSNVGTPDISVWAMGAVSICGVRHDYDLFELTFLLKDGGTYVHRWFLENGSVEVLRCGDQQIRIKRDRVSLNTFDDYDSIDSMVLGTDDLNKLLNNMAKGPFGFLVKSIQPGVNDAAEHVAGDAREIREIEQNCDSKPVPWYNRADGYGMVVNGVVFPHSCSNHTVIEMPSGKSFRIVPLSCLRFSIIGEDIPAFYRKYLGVNYAV